MSWRSRIKGKLGGGQDGNGPPAEPLPPVPPAAVWRDAAANPFGVPVLDLSPVTRDMVSATLDPAQAQRAISWGESTGSDLDDTELEGLSPVACELRYPVAPVLPDGLLFTPNCMEDKWVLARRKDRILAARSWTGIVEANAETRLEGDVLVIHALRVRETSVLRTFGDLVQVFDWLIRSHGLGQVLPLPVGEQGMATLEKTPLVAFSAFGRRAFCAARSFVPSTPSRPLRSDGAVLVAVRDGDAARVRMLCADGESVDAPTTLDGYTPLSVAILRRDVATVRALLELGADPCARSAGGGFPLGHAIMHGAPIEALEALVSAGANPKAVNDDGFGMLHAAAESGNAEVIPWLLGRGLDIEARTGRGHSALQIACGLGRVETAEALLDAGADLQAGSPGGTAHDIAASAGKQEVLALLERRARASA